MTLQRVLVTGGAGFIGSHTVDLLLNKGLDVVVLDNLSSGKLENLNLQHPNLSFIEGDVLEYPLIADLLADCDGVLHLAAIASVPQSIANPIYTFQVNTQGFLHVLEAVRNSGREMPLVYASSAAVYGEAADLPCRDDKALTEPALSPYALQKRHDEDYAHLYSHLHHIKSLGLRYFNVYGPRQDPNSPYSGVISRFLDAYHQGKALTVFGDGMQARDFIYVTDVAMANWLALQKAQKGVVNIATGQKESLLQLIAYLELAGKKPAEVQYEPERAGDIRTSYGATTLALERLGFHASISLKEGVQRMLQIMYH